MDKKRMIFVQIYIKILGFGQKSILMRIDLFEIFLSETSEIYLFFGISLVSDRKSMLFSFLEMQVGHYIAQMWQPFLYQNSNSTGCSTILCISL